MKVCAACPQPVIAPGYHGGDIGPASQKLFEDAIADAGTVFWNGPLGERLGSLNDMALSALCNAHVVPAVAAQGSSRCQNLRRVHSAWPRCAFPCCAYTCSCLFMRSSVSSNALDRESIHRAVFCTREGGGCGWERAV
jgi:hypothetical protein